MSWMVFFIFLSYIVVFVYEDSLLCSIFYIRHFVCIYVCDYYVFDVDTSMTSSHGVALLNRSCLFQHDTLFLIVCNIFIVLRNTIFLLSTLAVLTDSATAQFVRVLCETLFLPYWSFGHTLFCPVLFCQYCIVLHRSRPTCVLHLYIVMFFIVFYILYVSKYI